MCDNTTHEHPHTHGHDFTLEHGTDHAHEHDHSHQHNSGGSGSQDEITALLKYMIDHNAHHAEDLHQLFHALEGAGKAEAAALIGDALHYYTHGNEKLAEALKLLG